MNIPSQFIQELTIQSNKRNQLLCACEQFDKEINLRSGKKKLVRFVILAQSINTNPIITQQFDPIVNLRKFLNTVNEESKLDLLLSQSVADTSEKIYLANQKSKNESPITFSYLIAALEDNDQFGVNLYLNHLGSCRAYLIRDKEVYTLTLDQSYIRFLMDVGKNSWSKALRHSSKHDLTNYLGRSQAEKGDSHIVSKAKAWMPSAELPVEVTEPLVLAEKDQLIFVATQPTDDGTNIQKIVVKTPTQAAQQLLADPISAALVLQWGKSGIFENFGGIIKPSASPKPKRDGKRSTVSGWLGWVVAGLLLAMFSFVGIYLALFLTSSKPDAQQTPTQTSQAVESPTVAISAATVTDTETPATNEVETLAGSQTVTSTTLVPMPTTSYEPPVESAKPPAPAIRSITEPSTPQPPNGETPIETPIQGITSPTADTVTPDINRQITINIRDEGNGNWRFSWEPLPDIGELQYELTLCSTNSQCVGLDSVSQKTNRIVNLKRWSQDSEFRELFTSANRYPVTVFLYDVNQLKGKERQSPSVGTSDIVFPTFDEQQKQCVPSPCKPIPGLIRNSGG